MRRRNIIRSTVKTALIAKAARHIGRRVVSDHKHGGHHPVRHALKDATQHAMKDAVQHHHSGH